MEGGVPEASTLWLQERLGSMMRKFSWMLMVLLVLVGCSEEITAVVETEPSPPNKITWEKDGKDMALIPSGAFEMGDSKKEPDGLMENAWPVHTVELDAFYMDTTEVTVGQFRCFLAESGYEYDGNWNHVARYFPSDEYPMVYVSWNEATAYAEWAGKRLPTEAEWEKAARSKLKGQRYVWGDDLQFANHHANFNGKQGKGKWDEITAPVGSLFANNGYGLYDMVGNVCEWCADSYKKDYYLDSPYKNPKGPDSSTKGVRVLRGGSWLNCAYYLRVAYRYYFPPNNRLVDNRFRCVIDVDTDGNPELVPAGKIWKEN